MEAALSLALGRYGLAVENSPMKDAMQAVFVHAPDLAVLLGDAAKEEGGEVLANLAGRASTAVVPVALLSDDPDLERRLRAFRYGAVAVVPRSPSADEMARRIADIVHELPERDKTTGADLGETTLDELVRLVSTRLRSGILSVRAEGQAEGARIVLRGGQPVTEAIEQLVASIRPLVATPSGPLAFEFEEQPTGRLAAIADAEVAPPGEIDVRAVLTGRRFVLVERSPTRADDLVQALRGLGAFVAVVDGEGQGMEKARAIAPEIIVVDARGIGGWATPALRTIRHDLRLRWAALLVARADEIWPEGAPGADLSRLAAGVQPLIEADLSLTERAKTEEKFSARIESTGPERFIRALIASGQTLHVRVQHPRAVVDLDLAEGLVVGVNAKGARESQGRSAFPGKPIEASGVAALAVLLGLASGRAQIERKKAPSIANVMSPLDDAIAAADREAPPIRPSLPPPSTPPSSAPGATDRPMFPNALLNDPPELLRQLESLLIDLRQSMPPPGEPSTASRGASVIGALPAAPSDVPRAKTMPAMPKPITGLPKAPLPAIPRPGAIPAPAPVPSLSQARKKTLVGVMAPIAAPSVRDVSAPEISVPEISVPPPAPSAAPAAPTTPAAASPPATPASPPAPPAPSARGPSEPDSLANLLEPDSSEVEIPPAYPAAIPNAPPSVPPTALPPMPAPPLPVVTDTGALAAPSATPSGAMAAVPSPLPPTPDELETIAPKRPSRVGLWIALAMLAALGGGAAWLFLAGPGMQWVNVAIATPEIPTATPPSLTGGAAPEVALASVADVGVSDEAPAAPIDSGAPDAGVDAGAPDAGIDAGGPDAGDETAVVAADGDDEADDGEEAVDAALLGVTERRARIEYLIDRANYRRRHGEPAGAATDYEAVLRVESTNARALAGLARLNLDRGRGSEAVGYARRLTRTHPSQPANFVLLGDCLLAAGDRSGAIRAFQDALRLAPGYRTARERIADLPPR